MTNKSKKVLVRKILNQDWNPIGLTLSEDDDEYDDYVQFIMKHRDWQENSLTNYLNDAITRQMGMHMDEEKKRTSALCAKKIIDLLKA